MICKSDNPIAVALFVVNNHAKNAPSLYFYKVKTLEKLLLENKAKKIGYQRKGTNFFTLVCYQDFYYHIRSIKEDLKNLPAVPYKYKRNPKCYMSIRKAKEVLCNYIGQIPKQPDCQMTPRYTFYR